MMPNVEDIRSLQKRWFGHFGSIKPNIEDMKSLQHNNDSFQVLDIQSPIKKIQGADKKDCFQIRGM